MNFRDRIEHSREKLNNPVAANNNEQEEGFDSEFFGIDNIKSFPACIDLRLPEGNRKALPYSYIVEINFSPADGIEITTTTKKITITGRDLEKLFDYFAAFRVRYVQANLGTDATETGLFVSEILIEDV